MNLSTNVQKVERDEKVRKWNVTVQSVQSMSQAETHVFDRLVIATGSHGRPNIPKFNGSELFKGDLVHSHQFKDPSRYEGKTVIVLGTAATAADTIEFLRGAGAAKIYMSHRRSLRLVGACCMGYPFPSLIMLRYQGLKTVRQWILVSHAVLH